MGDMQAIPGLRRLTDGLTPASAAYVVIVLLTASGVFAALILAGYNLGNPAAVIGLAAVAAYGERGHINLRGGSLTVSISLLPAVFAAVLFGPLAAMVVFGASAAGLAFPWQGRLAYVGSRALTGAMAAGASAIVAGMMDGGTGETRRRISCCSADSASGRRRSGFSDIPVARSRALDRRGSRSTAGDCCVGSPLRAGCCRAGARIPRRLALDAAALLCSRSSRAAMVLAVSGSSGALPETSNR